MRGFSVRKIIASFFFASLLWSCAGSAYAQLPNGWGNAVPSAVGNPYAVTVLCHGTQVSAHTGDTNEATLATCNIPANAMGANGLLRITTTWEYTNSANNKTVRVRFGGLSGTVYQAVVSTTTAVSRLQADIFNANATNSQKGGPAGGFAGGFSSTAQTVVTSAVDTTAAVSLVFTGQLASAAENVQIDHYLVELITASVN
jgi:hypothetical protein